MYDFDRLREIMLTEQRCVRRNDYCDHRCAYCDLVMDEDELIDAFDQVVEIIGKLQIFYCLLDKIKDVDCAK